VEGESKANHTEAQQVMNLIFEVLAQGELELSDIGVVTPYMAQVRVLRRSFRESLQNGNARQLEIASVDNFQGREKELIIFSAVRSNRYGNVGFLADWRRLNVTLTRARRGLVVFGAAKTLRHDPHWQQWLAWCHQHDAISHTGESQQSEPWEAEAGTWDAGGWNSGGWNDSGGNGGWNSSVWSSAGGTQYATARGHTQRWTPIKAKPKTQAKPMPRTVPPRPKLAMAPRVVAPKLAPKAVPATKAADTAPTPPWANRKMPLKFAMPKILRASRLKANKAAPRAKVKPTSKAGLADLTKQAKPTRKKVVPGEAQKQPRPVAKKRAALNRSLRQAAAGEPPKRLRPTAKKRAPPKRSFQQAGPGAAAAAASAASASLLAAAPEAPPGEDAAPQKVDPVSSFLAAGWRLGLH